MSAPQLYYGQQLSVNTLISADISTDVVFDFFTLAFPPHLGAYTTTQANLDRLYIIARNVSLVPLYIPSPPGPPSHWHLWVTSFELRSSLTIDIAALPYGASSSLLAVSTDNSLLWAAVNFAQESSSVLCLCHA